MQARPLTDAHARALDGDATSRRLVVAALQVALGAPAPHLSDVLAKVFAEHRVGVVQREIVAAAVRAVVRQRSRLEYVAASTSASALLRAAVALSLTDGAAQLHARDAELAQIEDPVQRAERHGSLPPELARVFADEVGRERLDTLSRLVNRAAPLTLRVNRARAARDAVLDELRAAHVPARATLHALDGIVIEGAFDVYAHALFQSGRVEVQDEGSQLVAEVVAPPPRGLVVDVCAGAGGKTLALGAILGGRGQLVAIEPSRVKLAELARRARRAQLHSVRAIPVALGGGVGSPLLAQLERRADRVLVDAPCTGLGVLARNPEARWRFSLADLDRLAPLQRAILEDAARLVAPGGRLVYATCSFLRRECEDVLRDFHALHPEFDLVTVREVLGARRATPITDERGLALRTWDRPLASGATEVDLDGFYAAVLRRRA